jgi:hypothetical protein
VERGKPDVVPALLAMAGDPGVDAIGLNVGVIHALWTLHGLGALDGSHAEATAVAVAGLKHRAAGVRRNAVQVLPQDAKSVEAILDAGLTRNPDAQVRLMSLLALADQPPTPAAGAAIVAALSDPTNAGDRWIPDAATSAAANNSESFLKALRTLIGAVRIRSRSVWFRTACPTSTGNAPGGAFKPGRSARAVDGYGRSGGMRNPAAPSVRLHLLDEAVPHSARLDEHGVPPHRPRAGHALQTGGVTVPPSPAATGALRRRGKDRA